MNLKISLLQKKLTLSLIKDGQTVDSSSWEEDNTLSKRLLPEIDALLKKNGLELRNISAVETECDLPEQYTSGRIIKTIAETLNYAISGDK